MFGKTKIYDWFSGRFFAEMQRNVCLKKQLQFVLTFVLARRPILNLLSHFAGSNVRAAMNVAKGKLC